MGAFISSLGEVCVGVPLIERRLSFAGEPYDAGGSGEEAGDYC